MTEQSKLDKSFERPSDDVVIIDGKHYKIMSDKECAEYIWGAKPEQSKLDAALSDAPQAEVQRRIERYADLEELPDPYDEREGVWFDAAKMKAIVDEKVQAKLQAAIDRAREEAAQLCSCYCVDDEGHSDDAKRCVKAILAAERNSLLDECLVICDKETQYMSEVTMVVTNIKRRIEALRHE